jgi:hypothetical protein
MNKPVLLLGNGINNIGKMYSWEDLIKDLIKFVGLKDLDSSNKPFPLFYEEIFLSNLKNNKISEEKLKGFISEKVKNIEPTDLHKKIASWGFSDIITTNYDYTVENALGFTSSKLSNNGIVKENLYSVFRHTQVDGAKIWHIHGEVNVPRTILLGFEQYSGQLQQIRNYVATGTGSSYKIQFPPLVSKLKNGKIDNSSWLDLFFTQDIHIVGLTLDFVESDLWWLFTYRARMKLERRSEIRNSIFYYFPAKLEPKIKSKLGLLCANEIECVSIADMPDKKTFYHKIFDIITGTV